MSSRLTDTILQNALGATPGVAYAQFSQSPTLSLGVEGPFGYSSDQRNWLSSQAYVQRPLVAVLLVPPKFITLMNNPEAWYKALKNLVETHPVTIEGFNAGLKPEFDEYPFGGAGEMQQVIVDMKRARSEPVTTYKEREGRPIQNFLGLWLQFGMMDPDTKMALVRTMAGGNTQADWHADNFTMTCMFYEPDITNSRVDKCWITCNMMPMDQGDITGKRDLASSGETSSLSIPWTGMSVYNSATIAYAQAYLDQVNMVNANPMVRPVSVDGVDPAISSLATGYKNGLETTSLAKTN